MHEPPELLEQTATPAKILATLEVVRERYRMGLMDPPSFNEVLRLFQFRDSDGAVWTPGARSSQWYRRDGRKWVPAEPPALLHLPKLPMELVPETTAPPLPPRKSESPETRTVTCPTCGAPNSGKKFCTQCGTKLP